jgi:large subunit ribosomal protein L23
MKNLYEVVRRPLITEKSSALKDTQHTVTFEVHRDATKPEIRSAIEKQGRFVGRRPDWKKAYVVLKKGEKMIEFFEQA